jgi:hypothetical protein
MFTLKAAAAAALAGTEAEWLMPLFPFIADVPFLTADFCAAGPQAVSTIDISDLVAVATAGKSKPNQLVNAVFVAPKVFSIARDRVFAAYCQPLGEPASADVFIGVDAEFDVSGAGGNIEFWGRQGFQADYYRIITRRDAGAWTSNNEVHAAWGGVCFHPPLKMLPDNVGETDQIDQLATRHDADWPTELERADYWCTSTYGGSRAHVRIEAWRRAGWTPPAGEYVPTPQPKPVDYNQPGPNIYDTIGALGAELDRQEAKLDALLGAVQWLVERTASPPVGVDPVSTVLADPSQPVAIPQDATGVIVELEPPSHLARHGSNPPVVIGAAHAALGWAGAWQFSTPIKHTRQIIWPFPPSATDLAIDVVAGVSVRLAWLRQVAG